MIIVQLPHYDAMTSSAKITDVVYVAKLKQTFSKGEQKLFPNAPQKGSRFKVGVQGSRRRSPKVTALVLASVCKRLQAFASVGECRTALGIENRRETQNYRHFVR